MVWIDRAPQAIIEISKLEMLCIKVLPFRVVIVFDIFFFKKTMVEVIDFWSSAYAVIQRIYSRQDNDRFISMQNGKS